MSVNAIEAFKDNYIWAIIDESRHTAICVDPGAAEPVLQFINKNQLNLTAILVTHHHFDHCGGLEKLQKTFPHVEIFTPDDSRIPLSTIALHDEDIIHLGEYDFRVMAIPGHTRTHIAFYEPSKKWLFCGDTLFSAGCGRVFDGTLEDLYHSLQLIKNLPDETSIYCGHEYTRKNLQFAAQVEPNNQAIRDYLNYLQKHGDLCSLPSRLALEKQINPFLRTDSLHLKSFAQQENLDPDNSLAIFQRLREKKDNF
ncbi:hydroxyacylglutathione hydrolase [Legionella londiniensis]|uniref:Hydroxyacylglutathione hydrolase n=1 Tax=Legionella londiniensis TaxID=45068 RepID=A0A0W0VN55_9GAMM|nr:hydroxyacylglutathione hydrolase [Legionella londiniensis]KTD21556.1 hydroxyacylglutathione hydrolase (glyoxalase II) [Legionella londiniensis]STX92767.1 hydroxyacylglutathione hydrolase [Legionella londiniensis]